MADFAAYAAKGYGHALVPVVPYDAPISDYSWIAEEGERLRRHEQITATRGKVPGKRLRDDTWVGFGAFTQHTATAADHALWSTWNASVGLQARDFPAFDIDIEDETFVAALLRRIQQECGFIFGRVGRKPRILIPFRTAPGYEPRKLRLPCPSFGERAAVELLGAGQQYVIDGIHPKTEQPYSWGRRGFPEADKLPPLSAAQVDRIFAAAAEMAGVNGLKQGATTGLSTEVKPTVNAPNFLAVAEAVRAIPNDLVYDTWITLGHAIKNVTVGDDAGLDLWFEWSSQHPDTTRESCVYKWESFRPPYHAGWDTIRAMIPATSTVQLAAYDFTAAPAPVEPLAAMMDRYVWVERVERAFDKTSRNLLTDIQFSVRNNNVAPARGGKITPWSLFISDAARLQRAHGVTYRPGQEVIVHEKEGACVNTWIAPDFAPQVVTDSHALPWLEHMAFLAPDEKERRILLDWMAFIVQNPAEKPNFQLVWGSTHHGVGKDLALEPIRRALGARNVRNVQPEQILGDHTDWFKNARLIVVEDMQSYGKRAIESRLRPLMAAPPDYVSINEKFMPVFDVPNIAALIFLTNEMSALPISKEDRRYFVTWAGEDVVPRSEQYYTDMVAWYLSGGCDAAASWLMARDITHFNAKGRAPMTNAKAEMIGASLSPLEAWIVDGIAEQTGPFATDIVELGDLLKRVPASFKWDGGTTRRLAQYLEAAGGVKTGRTRLGKMLRSTETDRGILYIVRRHEMYVDVSLTKLAEMFWQQREAATQDTLKGEFLDAGQNSPSALL